MYDAHIHVGYYSRTGCDEPFYYSPKRIVGVLRRHGVEGFIVSSTCAQMACISATDIMREAREMRRSAGVRVHQLFWLTGRFYDDDRELNVLDTGLYVGVKLHEMETPWMRLRRHDLERVLAIADERGLLVQMHTGDENCYPKILAKMVAKFPNVRFDFAHCFPMNEMAKVIADCPNVWTDTAYMSIGSFPRLRDYDWHGRLMFGTDLPVWQAYEKVGLTKRYREYVRAFRETGLEAAADAAFRKFVCGGEKRLMMDVGQEMKMNKDEEWTRIDKIIKDVNRDMKLVVEEE